MKKINRVEKRAQALLEKLVASRPNVYAMVEPECGIDLANRIQVKVTEAWLDAISKYQEPLKDVFSDCVYEADQLERIISNLAEHLSTFSEDL